MKMRFTIDGSDALENRLDELCDRVLRGVQEIVPPRELEALVLGGGYGRGEGGVLNTPDGDEPYNDLEFYVFIRGNRLWQTYKNRGVLEQLAAYLSAGAGLHVEFKIDSLARLRRSPVSMFSYDLVARHRVLFGGEKAFQGCGHHLAAEKIPLAEATRLLFNRATGLLLVREMVERQAFTPDEADFAGRNLAKAQLALGDAVLAVFGQYHWSCRERHRRLAALSPTEPLRWLDEVRSHHAAGTMFKLHPRQTWQSAAAFAREHREISELTLQLWLWLESRRLNRRFISARDYAFSPAEKWPGASRWRNVLLNIRAFGLQALLNPLGWRYPRERLLNALTLLLWTGAGADQPRVIERVQQELHTGAADWTGLVGAYKQIWPNYG
jgi:hypothetical protein